MAYTNTENDGHEHELKIEIESAQWVIPPTGEVNGRPKVFKEGTAVYKSTCTKCGRIKRWNV